MYVKFYDKEGNKVKIEYGKMIYRGRNSKIYQIGDQECIKVLKGYQEEQLEEILKLLMKLELEGFVKIYELYYSKDIDKLKAFRQELVSQEKDFDILTSSTYYTLNNLFILFKSMVFLTENKVWLNDLHTDNVILGDNNMTIIDPELYTINRFFSNEQLIDKNIISITDLFFHLYFEAILKYHPELNTGDNVQKLVFLFKNNKGRELDYSCKVLSRYRYPIDYFKQK